MFRTAGVSLPPIGELNGLDRDAFTRTMTVLFERAPALAARLADERPFESYEALLARARALVAVMSEPEQVAILDAHPRIAARPEELSETSRREQGGADAETDRELLRLQEEYERRFGFPFVVFVAGQPRRAILDVLRARLSSARADELHRGLNEFLAIAADRLRKATV